MGAVDGQEVRERQGGPGAWLLGPTLYSWELRWCSPGRDPGPVWFGLVSFGSVWLDLVIAWLLGPTWYSWELRR